MQIDISFDIDADGLSEPAIRNLIADLTYEIRASRRLRAYEINYR